MGLEERDINTLTNHFIRMIMKVGLHTACGDGRQICLFKYENAWSLDLVSNTEMRLGNALTKFDYPESLPEDDLDAAIELAGLISAKLHHWANRSRVSKAGGTASANKLTPEQRSERAKKAVAARIAKYGQKSRK